jgi:flap endonuclease-1
MDSMCIMGIKHLNQFVNRECPGAIKTIPFTDLAGKVVAVDASIYMYRFAADEALLENMYSMVRMFQLSGIIPVFIFDGKPPDEKRNILNKRQRLKRIAEMHYNEMKLILERDLSSQTSDNEHALKMLKRKFVRLHDADFERVKTLLQALGVNYIVAPGEADAMCAQMVLKRKAHACASDDSDMFVYGCPRV